MIETLANYPDVNIIECDDVTSVLPSLVSSGNVLLVTSKGFVKRGTVSHLVEALGASRVMVFDEVTPNPEKSHLQRVRHDFSKREIKHIVALGGGSVIDAAKVLCALLSYPDSSLDELLSTDVVESHINLIAIPTTSGTGAEVTPFATVWQSDIGKKYSLYGVRPSSAILDPNLTLSLPTKETLYPALDALSHALESLWNVNSTEESRGHSHLSIQLICENLPIVLEHPDNREARKSIQLAASLAGVAISTTKTAIAHAISYPLTSQYGVPHGLACSFTLVAILDEIDVDMLKLPPEQIEKVVTLLSSLQLSHHVAQYVDSELLLGDFNYQLEPSRTKNFAQTTNKNMISRILSKSCLVTSG